MLRLVVRNGRSQSETSTLGPDGENGVHVSAGRGVHERCEDDRAVARQQARKSEGDRFGNPDDPILPQPRRPGALARTEGRTGESQTNTAGQAAEAESPHEERTVARQTRSPAGGTTVT